MSGVECGHGVVRLDFFDIEAEPLDPRALEEIIDLLGMAKSVARDHCDDMEWDAVVFQQLQAAHRSSVRALPATALAVRVVQIGGTIDA